MPEVPNLAQGAASARKAQEEATKAPEVIEAATAFLVFITPEGMVGSTPDLNAAVTTVRQPTTDEVAYAAERLMEDLKMQKLAVMTAQQVLNASMHMQQQMRQAQESAQVQAQLKKQPAATAFSKR
jgi:hypothetical protein